MNDTDYKFHNSKFMTTESHDHTVRPYRKECVVGLPSSIVVPYRKECVVGLPSSIVVPYSNWSLLCGSVHCDPRVTRQEHCVNIM